MRIFKNTLFVFLVLLEANNCTKPTEYPLILPPGAEPSAKSHNDYGIEDFLSGQYYDAFLHFNQASVADPHSGEIHFNKGLSLHMEGHRKKATEAFIKAKQYSKNNPGILKSSILRKYLKQNTR